MVFLHIKSLPNLLFGVLCLPGDQSHPFAQPTINPLAHCICWAGLLGRAVFPPWNEGPNFGSYRGDFLKILTWLTASQIALRNCSEEVREEPGNIGVFAEKQSKNMQLHHKRLLLIAKAGNLKLMIFSMLLLLFSCSVVYDSF